MAPVGNYIDSFWARLDSLNITFGHIWTTFCDNFATTLRQLWDKCETTSGKLWDSLWATWKILGTTSGHFWTNLGQLRDNFGTILRQLWETWIQLWLVFIDGYGQFYSSFDISSKQDWSIVPTFDNKSSNVNDDFNCWLSPRQPLFIPHRAVKVHLCK